MPSAAVAKRIYKRDKEGKFAKVNSLVSKIALAKAQGVKYVEPGPVPKSKLPKGWHTMKHPAAKGLGKRLWERKKAGEFSDDHEIYKAASKLANAYKKKHPGTPPLSANMLVNAYKQHEYDETGKVTLLGQIIGKIDPNGPKAQTNLPEPPKKPTVGKTSAGLSLTSTKFKKPDELKPTGEVLGGVSAPKVYKDSQGNEWLVKQPKSGSNAYGNKNFVVDLEIAASRLQNKAGLAVPAMHKEEVNGKPAAVSKMYSRVEPAFANPSKDIELDKLNDDDLLAIQQQQVFDWLISNHDSHSGNFLRTDKGIIGIDKGQAFKFFGSDKLSPDYAPVSPLGQDRPVYQTLWKQYIDGSEDTMYNPAAGQLHITIQRIQNIPDEDYKKLLRPYAEQAAASGSLMSFSHGGKKNDVEHFLDLAVQRKNSLQKDFDKLYADATAKRKANLGKSSGYSGPTKVAKKAVAKKAGGGSWLSPNEKHEGFYGGKYTPVEAYNKGIISAEDWKAYGLPMKDLPGGSLEAEDLVGEVASEFDIVPGDTVSYAPSKFGPTHLWTVVGSTPGGVKVKKVSTGAFGIIPSQAFDEGKVTFAEKPPVPAKKVAVKKAVKKAVPMPAKKIKLPGEPAHYESLEAGDVLKDQDGDLLTVETFADDGSPIIKYVKVNGKTIDGAEEAYDKHDFDQLQVEWASKKDILAPDSNAGQPTAPSVGDMVVIEDKFGEPHNAKVVDSDNYMFYLEDPNNPEGDWLQMAYLSETGMFEDVDSEWTMDPNDQPAQGNSPLPKPSTASPVKKAVKKAVAAKAHKLKEGDAVTFDDIEVGQWYVATGGKKQKVLEKTDDTIKVQSVSGNQYTHSKEKFEGWAQKNNVKIAKEPPVQNYSSFGAQPVTGPTIEPDQMSDWEKYVHGHITWSEYQKATGADISEKLHSVEGPKAPPKPIVETKKPPTWASIEAKHPAAKEIGIQLYELKDKGEFANDHELYLAAGKLIRKWEKANGNAKGPSANMVRNAARRHEFDLNGVVTWTTAEEKTAKHVGGVESKKTAISHVPVVYRPEPSSSHLPLTAFGDKKQPQGSYLNPHSFGKHYSPSEDMADYGNSLVENNGSHVSKVAQSLGVSQSVASTVKNYTNSMHTPINDYARTGKVGYGDEESLKKAVANMDAAFKGSAVKPLQDWTIITRDTGLYDAGVATSTGNVEDDLASLRGQIGNTLENKNYFSSSFGDTGAWNGAKVRLIMRCPPGLKGLWVGGKKGGYEGISTHSSEREIILPRGMKYNVLSADKSTTSGYKFDVVVEVVGWPD